MKKKKKQNSKLMVSANMPPLYHTLPGEKYHSSKSEVLKWLSERPELTEYLLEQAKNAREIYYDPTTGKWQGVNYNPGEEAKDA